MRCTLTLFFGLIYSKKATGFTYHAKIQGRLVAFVDINADRSLDLVIQNNAHISFYINRKSTFELAQTIDIPAEVRIIPVDVNGDGAVDIVFSREVKDWSSSWLEHSFLINQNSLSLRMNSSFTSQNSQFEFLNSTFISQDSHLFIADVFGIGSGQLLGTEKFSNELKLWTLNGSNIHVLPAEIVDATTLKEPCKSPKYHSNTFIDLNGDCLPDLFITCDTATPTYEIWINEKEHGYRLARLLSGIAGAGLVSFADVDADGTIDLIFPVCTKECGIRVVYNQQMPLCDVQSALPCRYKSALCTADDNFKFDFSLGPKVYIATKIRTI